MVETLHLYGHAENPGKAVFKEEWFLVRGQLACTNAQTLFKNMVLKDGLLIYPAFCYTSFKWNKSSQQNTQRPFKHQHWMVVLLQTPWNDDRDLNVTIKLRNVMRLSEYQPWLYQQTCPRQVGFPESAGTLSLLMSSPIVSALHSESVWLWSQQQQNYCAKTVLQHENEKPSITCI